MTNADYTLTHHEEPDGELPGFLGLVDEDAGSMSVTNDAEAVVRELARDFILDRYVILYRDTEGMWDRLLTQAGRFAGFAPVRRRTFEEAKARILEAL